LPRVSDKYGVRPTQKIKKKQQQTGGRKKKVGQTNRKTFYETEETTNHTPKEPNGPYEWEPRGMTTQKEVKNTK